ncbi:MAG TPA: hypothetical protein VMS99_11320 [Acidimicrobiia bacterium]|nr:hypothetical protein [Acidimicrobiia bacterium]
MRRLPAVALVVALMSISVSVSATETGDYKDKFTAIGWGGSDGSLAWSGPWSEIGDDGDEKKGNVRVVSSGNCASGNCIRISALTTLLGQIGATRRADTSDLSETTLRFDLKATASPVGSELEVQVTGGGGWVTVAEYQLGPALTVSPNIDVSDFGSENFSVRFMFSGLLLSSEVFVDNVVVRGTIIEETTTTTVPQTTTTTIVTTTSTHPPSTTTTRPGTTSTTTNPGTTGSTTSTSIATTTSTTFTTSTTAADSEAPRGGTDSRVSETPSSTTSTSSTTIVVEQVGGPGSGGDDATTFDRGGIRATARGLQASFHGELFGEVRRVASLGGVDFQADYNMAVEVIRASWAWMVLLGLLVAYSIISGLDRRRGDLDS